MAKWLDKYEQGGLVLKKKTKDNYGTKPNVNDAKVSAGPNFVGEGYTAYNWKSPAWGGQFEMGGSLPGSVGFMYARTQNPAPANGKYTKKTLASAQKGIVMPEAELTPDISKSKSKLSTAVKSGTQDSTATNLETDSFGQAYSKARKQGKTKFSYQGKDYSTKYKGTPEEQLKQTGITDAQLHDRNIIQEQLAKNLMPVSYDKLNAIGSLFTKNEERKELEKLAKTNKGSLWGVWTPEDAKRRLDAFNLYSGLPQKYNTFSVSKNKPSVSKDKDAVYYSITNDKLRKYLDERIVTYDLNAQKDIAPQFREFDNSIQYIPGTKNKIILDDDSGVMGHFTATLGKDEKGDYVSYYDKWDVAPKDFGKPLEIYDKIYLKDLKTDYKPKLQNGKALSPDADDRSLLGFNTPDPAFQNVKANAFVPFDRKDFEGIKQNIAGYMSSPLYMERLSKSIPDAENAKDVQQRRLNNLLGIKLNPNTVDDGTHYSANQNRINIGGRDFVDNSIMSHEIAHGIVPNITNSYGKQNIFAKAANVVGDLFQPYEQFSNSELEKINVPLSGKITAPNLDYMMARKEEHYKPQGSKASAKTAANETYGDLTGMRQLLLDNGITTEFGQELTPEIFKKAKENKKVQNAPAFQRMKLKFKDEDIIKMNNEVAYNNDNAPLDQAQNGKEMQYYQDGLDFKPKSISKKGKKIVKDDRGQWAHPGEVTEINSPDITMQGVDYPVLGISDTGDTQMMYPDQDYKFDGKKVTEYPMAQDGDWLKKYAMQPKIQESTRNKQFEESVKNTIDQYRRAIDPENQPHISKWTPKPGEIKRLEEQDRQRREENSGFLNRLAANPHVAKLQNNVLIPMFDLYTVGEGAVAAKAIAKPALKQAGKYLTEKTALKNAYKLNPKAFKPTEGMMYRGLGKEGMEDAFESGVFRAKQNIEPIMHGPFDFSKQFNKAYFSPKFDVADRYGKGYIAEVPRAASDWGKRYGKKEWSQIAQKDIPITEGKILQKDWWKGYKEVPRNKMSAPEITRGPVNWWESPTFKKNNPNYDPTKPPLNPFPKYTAENVPEELKPYLTWDTEIDWGKWNPEIPKNEKLMQEYINIENVAKNEGTWMKNPDGSKFAGTPEQFVQSRSENFKKAFPQGADVVYRGDRSHYEALRGKGEELYGKPIFTTPDKELAELYAYKEPMTSPYYNPNIETVEQKLQRMYGPDMTVEKFRNEYPEIAGRILETNDGGLYELAIPKTTNELTFNAGKNLHHYLSNPEVYDKLIKEGIVPHKRPEPGIFDTDNVAELIEKTGLDRATIKNVNDGKIADVLIHNQRPGNYAKSLRGNSGMFDMNNPNIYKALIPAVGTAGLVGASQKKHGGWLNKYK